MKKFFNLVVLVSLVFSIFACKSFDFIQAYTNPEYDDTEIVQGMLNSEASEIKIPKHDKGRPYIVRPLKLENVQNKKIIFEPGVVILAKKGEFHGKGDFLFSIKNCKDIHLIGYGATFRMRKDDYRSAAYVKSEWRHGIHLASNENTTIEGLKVESSGGDGVYVGYAESHISCKNTKLLNLTLEDNHRQGISVVAADGLLIEGCSIVGTRGTLPEAGIDFEPNEPSKEFANCVVRNCSFRFNKGAGIQIYLKFAEPGKFPLSITFENCVSKNNGLAAFSVIEVPRNLEGTIRVIDCEFKGVQFIKAPKSLIITDK
ncbi:MAG: right-handed parallel beta-helix repeat-containing protein [Treponemataceae bacterium]